MSEPIGRFVASRRPRWQALERLLAGRLQSLPQVRQAHELYRAAAADLSLAQRDYPGTDVASFLNQLCGRAYRSLYAPRPRRLALLAAFWSRGFPRAVQACLPQAGAAVALMALGAAAGAVAVLLAPEGARTLVSAELRAHVERGVLWTDPLLDAWTPSELAVSIFLNNVRVLFSAFALGLTFGLGTAAVLFFNGLTLAATVAYCFQKGLGWQLLAFTAAHGPVELSLLCLGGGAGLRLALALVSPGERSRGLALRQEARVALAVMGGAVPLMVGIGVVEGFISPGTLFPWPAKLALGAALGSALWTYLLFRRPDGPLPRAPSPG